MNKLGQPMRLTKRVVESADPSKGRHWLWDRELRGFGLQVEKSGTRTYIVRYRIKGQGRDGTRRFIKLGRHGDLTPAEAREQAKTVLGQVAAGKDPAAERARDRERAVQQRKLLTFEQLARKFLDEHVAIKRKPTTLALYESYVRLHALPAIGNKKISEIERQHVAHIHQRLVAKPTTANRVVAMISSAYGFAHRAGFLDQAYNPALGIEKYRERPRERYLSRDELQRLGQALHDAETIGVPWDVNLDGPNAKHLPDRECDRRHIFDRYSVAAIRLLLFTGARLREILYAEWGNIDLDRGLLHLSDSKTGRKTIVLGRPALDVIEALREHADVDEWGTPTGLIIEGQLPGVPRSDLKKPWAAIQRYAGLQDVRLHDLRHTFASVGVGASLGLPIVGKLLGHRQAQTTARYAHLDNDPVRRAADRIGEDLLNAMRSHSSLK